MDQRKFFEVFFETILEYKLLFKLFKIQNDIKSAIDCGFLTLMLIAFRGSLDKQYFNKIECILIM